MEDDNNGNNQISGIKTNAELMSTALLETYQPPLMNSKNQLKELIAKQNKIYIDLSIEKSKWDNAKVAEMRETMKAVQIYREKLIAIRKQMQNIYSRTAALKISAANIQAYKMKELQRQN